MCVFGTVRAPCSSQVVKDYSMMNDWCSRDIYLHNFFCGPGDELTDWTSCTIDLHWVDEIHSARVP
jgi:hypothetical protein